jgi:hypothetical protein
MARRVRGNRFSSDSSLCPLNQLSPAGLLDAADDAGGESGCDDPVDDGLELEAVANSGRLA